MFIFNTRMFVSDHIRIIVPIISLLQYSLIFLLPGTLSQIRFSDQYVFGSFHILTQLLDVQIILIVLIWYKRNKFTTKIDSIAFWVVVVNAIQVLAIVIVRVYYIDSILDFVLFIILFLVDVFVIVFSYQDIIIKDAFINDPVQSDRTFLWIIIITTIIHYVASLIGYGIYYASIDGDGFFDILNRLSIVRSMISLFDPVRNLGLILNIFILGFMYFITRNWLTKYVVPITLLFGLAYNFFINYVEIYRFQDETNYLLMQIRTRATSWYFLFVFGYAIMKLINVRNINVNAIKNEE